MKNVICNKCGKKLHMENGVLMEDAVELVKAWGYFSNKDGETHRLCLCEHCYDRLIKDFVVPVEIRGTTELV